MSSQKVTPFLWFDDQAEEAAEFYVSVIPNSRITSVTPMVVSFELDGQQFTALNGGPQDFGFTDAVSFVVSCESQEEVDEYWGKLTEGGEEGPCGWLKDRYGLSWQITPTRLLELLNDPDREKAQRATDAMMQMKKIDIAALEEAAESAASV